MKRLAALWIVGLVTAVPYAVYYLLFRASSDQYAWLITFVLFWIFGFWGIAGPILSTLRIRRIFNAIDAAGSSEELKRIVQSNESKEAVIELIASENHIPKFIARRLYHWVANRLSTTAPATRPGEQA